MPFDVMVLAAGAALALSGPDPQALEVNRQMAELARRSPEAGRARRAITAAIAALHDPQLARESRAALLQKGACVQHRIGLGAVEEQAIIAALKAQGLLAGDVADEAARAGLFPPLPGEGGPCPHLAVPVLAAAGGNSGSHHSWPGGLAVHTAENLALGARLARRYPTMPPSGQDRWRAAILWHDWAKALVLPWQADGRTRPELQIAGTGAHHVLGLAEALARGLPAAQVAAQACAHGLPGTDGQPVAGWLRAAALIARKPAPTPALTAACRINYAADQSWPQTDAAVAGAQGRLRKLALACGRAARGPSFELAVKNPILARWGPHFPQGTARRWLCGAEAYRAARRRNSASTTAKAGEWLRRLG